MSIDINTGGGIFGVVHLVLFCIALFQIISSSLSVGKKVLWSVVVIFFPCIGVLLWFFLGRR